MSEVSRHPVFIPDTTTSVPDSYDGSEDVSSLVKSTARTDLERTGPPGKAKQSPAPWPTGRSTHTDSCPSNCHTTNTNTAATPTASANSKAPSSTTPNPWFPARSGVTHTTPCPKSNDGPTSTVSGTCPSTLARSGTGPVDTEASQTSGASFSRSGPKKVFHAGRKGVKISFKDRTLKCAMKNSRRVNVNQSQETMLIDEGAMCYEQRILASEEPLSGVSWNPKKKEGGLNYLTRNRRKGSEVTEGVSLILAESYKDMYGGKS